VKETTVRALRHALAVTALLLASPFSARAQEPQVYPMWCRGATGLAMSNGQTIQVVFLPWSGPAKPTMSRGSCSWLDRRLRPGEPNHILYQVPSGTDARSTAKAINADGVIWTFWVYNAGRTMTATAIAQGALTEKP
jgi:hypothetical protein